MFRIRTEISSPQGGPYLSTMFFDEAGGTAQDAADAVVAFWQAMDNLMDNDCGWAVSGEIATINSSTGALTAVTGVTTVAGIGADASDPLPQANQMLVRWLTSVVVDGRVLRGRTFIPGMTEAAVSGGNLAGAWLEAAGIAANALIDDASSAFIIWHRPHIIDEVNQGDGAFSVVTSMNVWTEFAILRSRRD